ncbi:MAG: endonuclease III [Bacteroidota bacterium]|nr:endonuclease III [Bacteroidota bacterium]
MTRQERVDKFVEYFSIHLPKAETELIYSNAYELAVAVILSAQCTDKRVNQTTPEFFRIFPDIFMLSKSNSENVFQIIRSVTYPNSKAKHLVQMAKMVVEMYNGEMPRNVNELMTLPGIGRKSANVLASVLYNIPTMPVDTHVFRVAARIGLTEKAKNVMETERQLVRYLPEDKLNIAHHWLVLHGRYICIARKPKCLECGLRDICKYYNSKIKNAGTD